MPLHRRPGLGGRIRAGRLRSSAGAGAGAGPSVARRGRPRAMRRSLLARQGPRPRLRRVHRAGEPLQQQLRNLRRVLRLDRPRLRRRLGGGRRWLRRAVRRGLRDCHPGFRRSVPVLGVGGCSHGGVRCARPRRGRVDGKLPRYRCHLGCILLKMPACRAVDRCGRASSTRCSRGRPSCRTAQAFCGRSE